MNLHHSPRLTLLALACAGLLGLSACGNSAENTETQAPETSATATSVIATPTAASPTAKKSVTPSVSPSATPSVKEPTVTETTEPPRGTITTVSEEPAPAVTQTQEPSQAPESTQPQTNAQQTGSCDYGQIHISAEVSPGGGTAGSRYMNLTFTNSGSSPCSLSGYPSVNYVDDRGNQVGASAQQAAEWTSSGSIVNPGESATATLRETRAGLYDPASCSPTQAAGYRVSIPGTSSSLVLNYPAEACSSSATGQLSVGQIGAGLN